MFDPLKGAEYYWWKHIKICLWVLLYYYHMWSDPLLCTIGVPVQGAYVLMGFPFRMHNFQMIASARLLQPHGTYVRALFTVAASIWQLVLCNGKLSPCRPSLHYHSEFGLGHYVTYRSFRDRTPMYFTYRRQTSRGLEGQHAPFFNHAIDSILSCSRK